MVEVGQPASSLPVGLELAATWGARHVDVSRGTQRSRITDQFEPEDVIVVEQQAGESVFRRLEPQPLQEWLEEYSLSELWQKNVIGGRPTP